MPTPSLPPHITKDQIDSDAAKETRFQDPDYPLYSHANECGPDGWKGVLIPDKSHVLRGASWGDACNQHDKDYMTLGYSRDQADEKFRAALHSAVDAYIQAFGSDMVEVTKDVLVDEKYWTKEAREVQECIKNLRPKICKNRWGIPYPCGMEEFLDCITKTVMVDVEKVRQVTKKVTELVARGTLLTPHDIALMHSEAEAYYQAVRNFGPSYYEGSQRNQAEYEAWVTDYLAKHA